MSSEENETRSRPYLILGAVLSAGLVAGAVMLAFGSSGVSGRDHQNFRVIDGDTVQVGDTSFDLFGIDTPELGQVCFNGSAPWHCGLDAAGALHRRIAFDPPDCHRAPTLAVKGGPRQIICNTGGTPAAIILLEEGYAMALENAPENYKKAQEQARRASLGLWRGEFVLPAKWRKGERLDGEAVHTPHCPVKAVIAGSGKKIYYTPLDKEYPAIKLKSAGAGKCFGSDEAARDAGYSHHSAPGGAGAG